MKPPSLGLGWSIADNAGDELLLLLILKMNYRHYVSWSWAIGATCASDEQLTSIFCNNSAHFFTPLTQCILRLSCVRRVRMRWAVELPRNVYWKCIVASSSFLLVLETVYFALNGCRCRESEHIQIWYEYIHVRERWREGGGGLVTWVKRYNKMLQNHTRLVTTVSYGCKPYVLNLSAVLCDAYR